MMPACASNFALFVYGTLQFSEIFSRVTGVRVSGEPALLSDYQRRLVEAEPFPAIYPAPGAEVRGALYRDVPLTCLPQLDKYEGDLYRRELVSVKTAAGEVVAAQSYVLNREHSSLLATSDWDAHKFLRDDYQRFLQELERAA
jgi:gamma-glutamylcyclotransferase (GGCT)/AIG2-like uncharacterized protein YtfP